MATYNIIITQWPMYIHTDSTVQSILIIITNTTRCVGVGVGMDIPCIQQDQAHSTTSTNIASIQEDKLHHPTQTCSNTASCDLHSGTRHKHPYLAVGCSAGHHRHLYQSCSQQDQLGEEKEGGVGGERGERGREGEREGRVRTNGLLVTRNRKPFSIDNTLILLEH